MIKKVLFCTFNIHIFFSFIISRVILKVPEKQIRSKQPLVLSCSIGSKEHILSFPQFSPGNFFHSGRGKLGMGIPLTRNL